MESGRAEFLLRSLLGSSLNPANRVSQDLNQPITNRRHDQYKNDPASICAPLSGRALLRRACATAPGATPMRPSTFVRRKREITARTAAETPE